LAQKIKKWLKKDLDVYVYFNNDAHGYAVENAKTLLSFVSQNLGGQRTFENDKG